MKETYIRHTDPRNSTHPQFITVFPPSCLAVPLCHIDRKMSMAAYQKRRIFVQFTRNLFSTLYMLDKTSPPLSLSLSSTHVQAPVFYQFLMSFLKWTRLKFKNKFIKVYREVSLNEKKYIFI